jgi:hypothetical protein
VEDLAALGTRQRQRRRRPDEREAEVRDAAVAVVERQRGGCLPVVVAAAAPLAVGLVLVRDVFDPTVAVAVCLDAVRVRLAKAGVEVERAQGAVALTVAVALRAVVRRERERERGPIPPVRVVGAVAGQVAHRCHDPADHEGGELDESGLETRRHAASILSRARARFYPESETAPRRPMDRQE